MEFTIEKNTFLSGLSKVQGIVSRTTSFPITSNVLIKAGENEIIITATDMETVFMGRYPAQIILPGALTVPGKKLFEVVRDFPDEIIPVRETDSGWIKISNEKLDNSLMSMSATEFPDLPEPEKTGLMKLSAIDFLDALEKADLPAPATGEDKRPHLVHLLGFYISIYREEENPPVLRLVSTDGHRLAVSEYRPENPDDLSGLQIENGVVLPKKALGDLKRLSEGEGEVNVGVRDSHFIFSREKETLMGRLLEGEYPDYKAVIPADIKSFIVVQKSSFMSILKRISIFTSDNCRAVTATISPESIRLHIKNPDIGESQEDYSTSFDGEPFETAFNPRYLIDALNVMKSMAVKIWLEKDKRAFLVTGQEDPGYLMVIMPMRN